MITFTDALEGLNKWKDRCTQTITDGFTRYSGGMTKEGVEAISKYYYYLGACNAYVTSGLIVTGEVVMKDVKAIREWLGGRKYDI